MTRHARRTDATQTAIVDALRAAGWGVRVYSSIGDGIPDLRVYRPKIGPVLVGVWLDAKSDGGELRDTQREFARMNPEQYFVAATTPENAIQMCHKAMAGRLERGVWHTEKGIKA